MGRELYHGAAVCLNSEARLRTPLVLSALFVLLNPHTFRILFLPLFEN